MIINGKPIGVMAAREYYRHKKEYIPAIMDAYHELEKKYDIIVIEGAGSPAEINLKKDDIVNMGMAKLADAPVLLCRRHRSRWSVCPDRRNCNAS